MTLQDVHKYISSVLKVFIASLWKVLRSLHPMKSALNILRQPYSYCSAIIMPSQSKQTSGEVYLLPLTDDGAPDVPGEYIYLPPPTDPVYIVRFAIEGTSSICRQGSLWVNAPTAGEHFQRDNYREYKSASVDMKYARRNTDL